MHRLTNLIILMFSTRPSFSNNSDSVVDVRTFQSSQCGITSTDDIYQNNIVLNKDCEAFILAN